MQNTSIFSHFKTLKNASLRVKEPANRAKGLSNRNRKRQ